MSYFNIYFMFSKFFGNLLKRGKKDEKEVIITEHTHKNVDDFIASFNDEDLNVLRSELICCDRGSITDHINEILSYLKGKCTDQDLDWYSKEIRKEYKK